MYCAVSIHTNYHIQKRVSGFVVLHFAALHILQIVPRKKLALENGGHGLLKSCAQRSFCSSGECSFLGL